MAFADRFMFLKFLILTFTFKLNMFCYLIERANIVNF